MHASSKIMLPQLTQMRADGRRSAERPAAQKRDAEPAPEPEPTPDPVAHAWRDVSRPSQSGSAENDFYEDQSWARSAGNPDGLFCSCCDTKYEHLLKFMERDKADSMPPLLRAAILGGALTPEVHAALSTRPSDVAEYLETMDNAYMALKLAANFNSFQTLIILRESYGVCDKIARANDNFALIRAAYLGNWEALEELRLFGLTAGDARARGNMAFHFAAKHNDAAVLIVLQRFGLGAEDARGSACVGLRHALLHHYPDVARVMRTHYGLAAEDVLRDAQPECALIAVRNDARDWNTLAELTRGYGIYFTRDLAQDAVLDN